MSTIPIPAEIVPHVQREALFLIGRAGSEIHGLQERRELDPEAIAEALGRLDRSRALFGAIGWPAPGAGAVVGPEHLQAIRDALRVSMTGEVDMAQAARDEGNSETAQRHDAELDTLLDYAGALSAEGGGA